MGSVHIATALSAVSKVDNPSSIQIASDAASPVVLWGTHMVAGLSRGEPGGSGLIVIGIAADRSAISMVDNLSSIPIAADAARLVVLQGAHVVAG